MKKLLFITLLFCATLAGAQNNNFNWIRQATYNATGTNTYAVTIPGYTANTIGTEIKVLFTNGNTGASTLQIGALAAVTLRKNGSSALSSGDILPGATYRLTFDGTYFQVLGIGGSGGGSTTWASITGKPNFDSLYWKTGDTTTIQSDVLIQGDYRIDYKNLGGLGWEFINGAESNTGGIGHTGFGATTAYNIGLATFNHSAGLNNIQGFTVSSEVDGGIIPRLSNYTLGPDFNFLGTNTFYGHKILTKTILASAIDANLNKYVIGKRFKRLTGPNFDDLVVNIGYINDTLEEGFGVYWYPNVSTTDANVGLTTNEVNGLFKVTPVGIETAPLSAGGPPGLVFRSGGSGLQPLISYQLGTGLAISGSNINVTNGTPTGGDVGQVLTKNSSTNYDASWQDPAVAYTDELAQDAVGAMVDASLTYNDATPSLSRAALTGAITASAGSNTTALGSFTKAQLDGAVSDGNVLYVGDAPTAHTLDSHSNVTITANTSGELLQWNGSAWLNRTLAEAGIQPAGSYLTGNQTITLSGDVTGSGATAITTTIANDAVSYAKMQNVSAASRLIGRGDSGSGDPQEITIGSGLTMTGTTLSASGGGGSSAFNDLTAATATNTINNGSFLQTWNWNGLTNNYGLSLFSNSTAAASNGQGLFSAQLTGANANSGQSTITSRIINNHTGTSSTNYAVVLNASSGTNNYALWVDEGNFLLDAGVNFQLDETVGTKIGTSATQKLGFYDATPVVKQAAATSAQDIADVLTAYGLLPASTISGGGGSGLTYAQVKALKFK